MQEDFDLVLHSELELAELADWILSPEEGGRPVVVLSGKPASGRRYLLRTAINQARSRGKKVAFSTFDLDGYEPDQTSIADFLRFQLEKRGRSNGDELVAAFANAEGSLRDVALAAIAVGLDEQSQRLLPAILGSLGGGREALRQLVGGLDDDETLVAHVLDAVGQFALLRGELLELTEDPRFGLASSCEPHDGDRKIARDRGSIRFELMSIDAGELRAFVGDRIEAEEGFFQAVVDSTGGSRGGAAAAIASLLSNRALSSGGGELTYPLELVSAVLNELEQDQRTRLHTFLSAASLCGDNIPVRSLLNLAGVSEDDLDDQIDFIDENLGTDSDLKLFAERFQHPGFPNELVYGFSDPLLPHAILSTLQPVGAQQLAGQMLSFLTQRLGLQTRATVRLAVELFRGIDAPEAKPERMELERELSWWVPDADIDETGALIRDELERGIWTVGVLWTTANTIQARWPPLRALMALDACRVESFPANLNAAYYAIRSGLLLHLERYADANLAAREGLNHSGDDKLLESALWERLATASANIGQSAEAEQARTKSLELRQQLLAAGDPQMVKLFEQTAAALRREGRDSEAAAIESQLPGAAPG